MVETSNQQPRVVILLENLPVQRDRRVWRQARALVEAGVAVTVICPASDRSGPALRAPTTVDGVEIRAFTSAPERSGPVGFIWEYTVAWIQMTRALRQCRRDHAIGGMQVCNPPDIFFPHGWWARWHGVPFVFDQHDLTPELFETRFGPVDSGWRHSLHTALTWCERATYRAATRVIATNHSYRRVAVERGSMPPDDVEVVRNGPDPERMRPRPVTSVEVPDCSHLVVWMGNMGPQDGVDDAVRAMGRLVHEIGRTDTHLVFIGTGEVLEDCRALAGSLGLENHVTFTGWIPDDEAFEWLSAADVGLSADPPGPLNDKSTMNKTMEYMAFGLPVVAHDLHETRVSAGPAGVYAETGDPAGLARCLHRLLDDPELMVDMGHIGRQRIDFCLSWPRQARGYVRLWSSLLGIDADDGARATGNGNGSQALPLTASPIT